jgi:histidine triad (HIT) family protein
MTRQRQTENRTSIPDMAPTVFEKIIARQIPARLVYEDEQVLAFHDIHPQAPTHLLVIPRKPISRVAEAKLEDQALLGHLLLKAAEVAAAAGLKEGGYRLVINSGPDGGESVPHLHCHILGGRRMGWPPG